LKPKTYSAQHYDNNNNNNRTVIPVEFNKSNNESKMTISSAYIEHSNQNNFKNVNTNRNINTMFEPSFQLSEMKKEEKTQSLPFGAPSSAKSIKLFGKEVSKNVEFYYDNDDDIQDENDIEMEMEEEDEEDRETTSLSSSLNENDNFESKMIIKKQPPLPPTATTPAAIKLRKSDDINKKMLNYQFSNISSKSSSSTASGVSTNSFSSSSSSSCATTSSSSFGITKNKIVSFMRKRNSSGNIHKQIKIALSSLTPQSSHQLVKQNNIEIEEKNSKQDSVSVHSTCSLISKILLF
jgi:hypothetical protein